MEIVNINTASVSVIVYDVADMTHLRYFVPIVSCINRIFGSKIKQLFVHNRTNSKYNGMQQSVNWKRYCSIINELNITSVDRNQIQQCDILFTVESSDFKIHKKRHISISHGLDILTHAKNLVGCDAYICSNIIAPILKNINVIIPPFPPTFFDFINLKNWATNKYVIDDRRIATIFYPDKGFASFADKIILQLIEQNYNVYIKQRRKWQGISSATGTHIYDDIWSPAEAVGLPIISDIVIGFGSTAYIDLIHAGINYIDFPVYGINNQIDMSSYSSFKHGNISNIQEIIHTINLMIDSQKQNLIQYNQNEIDNFLYRIII